MPLLLRAYELWEQLETDSGADLMTLTGGIYLGRPDEPDRRRQPAAPRRSGTCRTSVLTPPRSGGGSRR